MSRNLPCGKLRKLKTNKQNWLNMLHIYRRDEILGVVVTELNKVLMSDFGGV